MSHNQSGKGFVWSELPKETASEREEVCHVMYAALTSQDQYKDQTQTGMGKEFSGVTSSGRRVMGVHCPVSIQLGGAMNFKENFILNSNLKGAHFGLIFFFFTNV